MEKTHKVDNSQGDWGKEQKDDLFKYGYKGLIGWLQGLGHKKIISWKRKSSSLKCLELGIGQGYQPNDDKTNQTNFFIGSDLSYHNLEVYKGINPGIKLVVADSSLLPFATDSFDCIYSIYVLEHILELDLCFKSIRRILKMDGDFLVALPAEGGFLYKIGRNFTTKRYMERKFNLDYDAIIKENHLHTYPEIFNKLRSYFKIMKIRFLPFIFLPSYHINSFVAIKAKNLK
jgi:SAM-dependent methyltransferase